MVTQNNLFLKGLKLIRMLIHDFDLETYLGKSTNTCVLTATNRQTGGVTTVAIPVNMLDTMEQAHDIRSILIGMFQDVLNASTNSIPRAEALATIQSKLPGVTIFIEDSSLFQQ